MSRHLPFPDRFWAKVIRADGQCWLWTGAKERNGYGKVVVGRTATGSPRTAKAHRVSWELSNGVPIPDATDVLHSCDVRLCVNPAHLRLGNDANNAADRAARHRGKEHRQRGESNDNAKLTEAMVRQIIAELQRLPRRSQAAIAADFGVKQPQISRIMLRQNWAHIWDE